MSPYRKNVLPALLPSLVLLLSGCNSDNGTSNNIQDNRDLTCTAGEPSDNATIEAGAGNDDTVVLPNGRLLRPVGERMNLGYKFPLDVEPDPSGRMVAVTAPGKDRLLAVSSDLSQVIFDKKLPAFLGLAFSKDGKRLYAAIGPTGLVDEFAVSESGLELTRELDIGGYVSGIALAKNDEVLVVARNTDSGIVAMNLGTGEKKEGKAGRWPYDLAITPDGGEVYISNWADRSVSVLDMETMKTLATINVGKAPEGIAFEEGKSRAFVACADADRIDVIDLARRSVSERIDLTQGDGLLGASPQHIAIDEKGGRLYVTLGDLNQVEVISLYDLSKIGAIPVGEYPSGLALSPDRSSLYVVESLGLGGGHHEEDLLGTLAKVPVPDLKTLADWTKTTNENNNTRDSYYKNQGCENVLPVPVEKGKASPLEHVVLIVKENKTYDMVLGDLEGTNGDPELAIFGEKFTPNTHALAKRFANMDNYYSNPEVSLQGHLWTTHSECNDFTEKARFNMLPMTGITDEATPPAGSIFDHLFAAGIGFRNYGEVVGFGFDSLGKYEDFIDKKYPFFDLGVPDVDKAAEVIREMEQGIFPTFVYIALPNDHTYGTKPGKPAPEYMVADNDAALGMLIEAITHSPYWDSTVIFVIEDDPQGIGDHVDPHRSISLVISPWVKRGYLSHVHYDIPSLYATIERILGIDPLNRNDANAPPVFDVFSGSMDDEPYTAIPNSVDYRVNTLKTPMAKESAKLDFEHEDRAPGLGAILWHYMKGVDTPIPPQAKYIDE
ncbi:MAG: hypothetical protein GXP49_09960 [Deltaproteobacteria bacterium]|nr:hypothetical protein [Deltaproteobacteria bacterium]